jgi:DNA-binding transcriptional LysR family regulator
MLLPRLSKQMRQDNRFLVPDFALFPMLVETAGLVSVVPKSLASHYSSRYAFKIFDPPFPPLTLKLLWSRSREKDLRLRWHLDQIREAFRRLQASQ